MSLVFRLLDLPLHLVDESSYDLRVGFGASPAAIPLLLSLPPRVLHLLFLKLSALFAFTF